MGEQFMTLVNIYYTESIRVSSSAQLHLNRIQFRVTLSVLSEFSSRKALNSFRLSAGLDLFVPHLQQSWFSRRVGLKSGVLRVFPPEL